MDTRSLGMVKLHITYPGVTEGIMGESLWATPLKGGKFRLENEPLFDDLCYGDIVKAKYVDGILEYESFVMRDTSRQQISDT